MKKYIPLLLMIISCSCSGGATPFQKGDRIVISTPVYRNLYLSGKEVVINAPVYGDLFVGGGVLMMNDTITGDVHFIGASVLVNGVIEGDMRCIGGSIRINGEVHGELLAAGGSVAIEKGAIVHSLYATGSELRIDGTVKEDCTGYMGTFLLSCILPHDPAGSTGAITINGHIAGDAVLGASEI